MIPFRALKAQYTVEIEQNLKTQFGLDAEVELENIISKEIRVRGNALDFLYDEEVAEAELDRQLQAQPEFLFRSREVDPNLQWMIGYDGTTEEDDYEGTTQEISYEDMAA